MNPPSTLDFETRLAAARGLFREAVAEVGISARALAESDAGGSLALDGAKRLALQSVALLKVAMLRQGPGEPEGAFGVYQSLHDIRKAFTEVYALCDVELDEHLEAEARVAKACSNAGFTDPRAAVGLDDRGRILVHRARHAGTGEPLMTIRFSLLDDGLSFTEKTHAPVTPASALVWNDDSPDPDEERGFAPSKNDPQEYGAYLLNRILRDLDPYLTPGLRKKHESRPSGG